MEFFGLKTLSSSVVKLAGNVIDVGLVVGVAQGRDGSFVIGQARDWWFGGAVFFPG